jgi:hypothetical protein
LSWVASFVLWYRYAFTRPAAQDPAAGRIYSLNTHGSLVYLTSSEYVVLYALMCTGAVFFVVCAFAHWRERVRTS